MIPGLLAHLWQSTLFAGAAWLLTLALRKNQAQVRYRIWFIASVKFLVPFSLVVGLGTLVPRHATPSPAQTGWVGVAERVGQPLFTIPGVASRVAVTAEGANRNYLAAAALALWACGFSAIAICWLIRWKRVHALRTSAMAAKMEFPVAVMSADGLIEPGIFGIFRPVLLLPKGIEERIEREQLEAILAHELCHARRHDNLTAAIHMVAQAIFWFHPLVWWLGARLVDERERACDEEVLRLGSKPQVYAAGILSICKLYVESPLACVSGVTGADLRKRIEAIMRNRTAHRLNFAKKIALVVTGALALALPFVIGVINAPLIRAQAPPPAFDAASVKPTDPKLRVGMDFRITGGRLVSTNWTLELLMREAYSVRYYQIFGGPAWLRDDKFSIDATAGQNASRDQMLAMLRTLLENRFKLKVHREMREGNVYVLTLGKGAHKLKPPAHDTDRPMVSTFRNTPSDLPGVSYTEVGQNATLAQLTEALSNIVLGPVTDRTGITGNFDFRFDYATLDAPADTGPSVFSSVQDQLGVRLEAQKGPVEVLVIDHAEKPSEN
jgi:bla regulator protein blaR1